MAVRVLVSCIICVRAYEFIRHHQQNEQKKSYSNKLENLFVAVITDLPLF